VIDHHLAVARDPVSMKSGLEDPAVPPMGLPLGTEKPLTRDALSRLERQPSEVTLMGNQHVLDVVGVGEQVELYSAESIVGDVAVAARRTQEQSERIASERKEGHPGSRSRGPGGRAGLRMGFIFCSAERKFTQKRGVQPREICWRFAAARYKLQPTLSGSSVTPCNPRSLGRASR